MIGLRNNENLGFTETIVRDIMNWSPHHNNGKTLEWGKDISE